MVSQRDGGAQHSDGCKSCVLGRIGVAPSAGCKSDRVDGVTKTEAIAGRVSPVRDGQLSPGSAANAIDESLGASNCLLSKLPSGRPIYRELPPGELLRCPAMLDHGRD